MLKVSHWSRNVYWDLVDMKSLVATLQLAKTGFMGVRNSDIWRPARKRRRNRKSFVTSVSIPRCLPNLPTIYNSLFLIDHFSSILMEVT